ncbi:MAG TPA: DEAD/DEAH box helicase [Dongiaceae bacterium]|nr:DEAD/DEAH box helicase [Dongiaceae bacterium]
MNFSDLGLSPEVLNAIGDSGYTTPTPIQAQAIPVVLTGRDVLGCAQTGTGKTASFTLPMIDVLTAGRAKARMPRSLIIEPTRELAAQVAESFDRYGKYHKLSKALLIGGESFTDQEKALDRGVDVLIATPGRLLDLFERGKILMSDVKILVIDEADRMLDMGFIPDVERIVSLLPKIRQTLFFSATMPPEIRRLADAFLMNPKEISVSPPASPATTVIQGLAVVADLEKREALRRLIRAEQVKNALIFCNRKRDVDVLHRSLERHRFDAAALHGDMPQSKRTETLEKFKRGDVTLLVASDVAARGLDIVGLSHVFNFDVPMHAEDYIHRIGRTGRAGREGRAFTLATPDDGKYVEAITRLLGRDIPRIEIEGIAQHGFEAGDRRRRRRRGGDEPRVAAAKPQRRERRPHRSESRPAESQRTEPLRVEEARAESPRPEAPRPEQSRAEAAPAPRPRPEPRPPVKPAERHERRPRDAERTDDDKPVLAFGDHMPEFLRRPVQLPPALRKKADAA